MHLNIWEKMNEKLKKKWEDTGILDGLHASSDNNLVCNNTTTDSVIITPNNYFNNLTVNSIPPITGTNTLTINSSPTYSNFIDIPNDKELTIDISKRLIKMFDFAGVISEYILKKFKTILINEKEEDVIVAERNLLPGEFSKIREHLEGEFLLEFEQTPDRYGSKYILFPKISSQNIAMPLVQAVAATTIANDLVTVQPLNTPVGNLFYMDFQYNNDTNTGINNTYTYSTNNLELIT